MAAVNVVCISYVSERAKLEPTSHSRPNSPWTAFFVVQKHFFTYVRKIL